MGNQINPNEHQEFEQEYRQVSKDVKRVIISNVLLLIILMALYFANQKIDFLSKLESWF